tara:strand:- start:35 stop:667 length:633 start_codon:yes stop_codon:yes gene_type:complete
MESGKRLVSLNLGLHPLEIPNGNEEVLLIGVHGSRSQGFEWIYPLQTVDNNNTLTFFYRWNDQACVSPSANNLVTNISALLKEHSNIELVVLIGHSYGGVLVYSLIESWDLAVPVEIHSVAGPLAGIQNLYSECGFVPPVFITRNVSFFEWRTQQQLDGAFKDLDTDPQIIYLNGSTVTQLPDTYRGRRLGHNWSISWVADKLDQFATVE